uniref:Uncharacterized protein n=1 Tax=Yersinia enterocolitica W22703 TaxID=913028 RepID=F4N172_YEREN|nr:hypothetical protein YEW_AP03100 [Yersinia enterocolitica W22703]
MFTSQEGKKVPQVAFHTRQGDQWVDVTTDELFNNKTVIVFSLPGAFTRLVLPAICRVITNWPVCLNSTVLIAFCVCRSMILS